MARRRKLNNNNIVKARRVKQARVSYRRLAQDLETEARDLLRAASLVRKRLT